MVYLPWLVILLIPYWLGPIIVWLTQKARARPVFERFTPGRHLVPEDVAGLVAFLALLLALAIAAFRAVRAPPGLGRDVARACASVLAGAAVLGLTQSYLTSIGNLASTTVWIPALLVPALAWRARSV